jgi:hypothetical protein
MPLEKKYFFSVSVLMYFILFKTEVLVNMKPVADWHRFWREALPKHCGD